MLVNDSARLNVWLSLKDRTNYSEFIETCKQAGLAVMLPLEFAQKVGLILCGQVMFPSKPLADAYVAFGEFGSSEMRKHMAMQAEATAVNLANMSVSLDGKPVDYSKVGNMGCGSCGGGKVL